ncbi:hypothetical protein DSECCO2_297690 [anaerobic digester metagenome]
MINFCLILGNIDKNNRGILAKWQFTRTDNRDNILSIRTCVLIERGNAMQEVYRAAIHKMIDGIQEEGVLVKIYSFIKNLL